MPDPMAMPDAIPQMVSALSWKGGRLRWFGDTLGRDSSARSPEREVTEGADALTQALYEFWYTIGRPVPVRERDGMAQSASRKGLTGMLAMANPGRGRLERDWECVDFTPGGDVVVVRKNGLTLSAPRDRVSARDDEEIGNGSAVCLRTPNGSRNRSAGFYVAHSDAQLGYEERLTRVYCNITPESAPTVLHDVCTVLNAAAIPFDFKVAADASTYFRADVAVLYTERVRVAEIWTMVGPVLRRHAHAVRPPVPALVHAIRPGIGVADDPASGESFGQDRCRAIATGFVAGVTEADPVDSARSIMDASITGALREKGIDPVRPYLTRDSVDVYASLS